MALALGVLRLQKGEQMKEFRQWAKEHNYVLTREDGVFTNTHTQSAWEAWQAAAEIQRLRGI
jgi:hypothetical protein